jgi:hypothetical protein
MDTTKENEVNERFVCIDGKWQVVAETRSPEQIAADRERATLAFKVRVNELQGVDSPNMKARIAELTR